MMSWGSLSLSLSSEGIIPFLNLLCYSLISSYSSFFFSSAFAGKKSFRIFCFSSSDLFWMSYFCLRKSISFFNSSKDLFFSFPTSYFVFNLCSWSGFFGGCVYLESIFCFLMELLLWGLFWIGFLFVLLSRSFFGSFLPCEKFIFRTFLR